MTCIYCTDRETLGRHHIACPARPTADEVAAGQLDSAQVDIPSLDLWRQGYDHAAAGHALTEGEPAPEFQLGWSRRASRETPPQLRPAVFLSLRALLERLRGLDLRTDTFGIQLATSLFYLNGDAAEVSRMVRYWAPFPRLRDPSPDEAQRAHAQHVLLTSTEEAARREAQIVLHGEPDDEIRLRVHEMLRAAEASGRLVWRRSRDINMDEVDALLQRHGFRPTGSNRWPGSHLFPAIIEAANGGHLLAAA